jgi:hypothetical protein
MTASAPWVRNFGACGEDSGVYEKGLGRIRLKGSEYGNWSSPDMAYQIFLGFG